MNELDLKDCCPRCRADFDGGPIPEEIREHYSPPYRWSRKIGIEISEIYDGVSYWKCPDCLYTWKRFPWLKDYNELNKSVGDT